MKRLLIVLFVLIPISISAQTLHTIMMCNKNDRTLARGNEGEVKEMQYLIPTLAAKLGFKSNFIVHSGIEFTYTILNQEISNLNVSDGDIVIFYYASHGVNWSDSEWNAYYHFLAEVFENEDKYMSEYLADAEANY